MRGLKEGRKSVSEREREWQRETETDNVLYERVKERKKESVREGERGKEWQRETETDNVLYIYIYIYVYICIWEGEKKEEREYQRGRERERMTKRNWDRQTISYIERVRDWEKERQT